MNKRTLSSEDFHKKAQFHSPHNSLNTCEFKDTVFVDALQFYNPLFKLVFINCDFEEDVNIQSSSGEIIFEHCTFKKSLNLLNCRFEKNAKFWKSTFNVVNFTNTTFKGLADFWACTFTEKVIFYKTDFLGTTVFSAASFQKAALFTYTAISKVIIFRGTQFQNGLDLSQAIISGNVSLHDIKVKPFEAVDDVADLFLYESYIREVGLITYRNKRETFRTLKQYYSKNGNEIDSLEFRMREHSTLFQEMSRNLIHRKNIGSSIQNMLLLFFNCISNYFGVSYVLSLFFIILFGGLFYLLSICSLADFVFTGNWEKWDWHLMKYFFEFLNPTHKIEYIQKHDLTVGFYVFDFLGRVFVGYGIYQFIQAFRKYK